MVTGVVAVVSWHAPSPQEVVVGGQFSPVQAQETVSSIGVLKYLWSLAARFPENSRPFSIGQVLVWKYYDWVKIEIFTLYVLFPIQHAYAIYDVYTSIVYS